MFFICAGIDIQGQRLPLFQLSRVNVGEGFPLGHRLVELLEGIVHHQLGLLPFEVCLNDPVPHLFVLVQRLFKLVLLHRTVFTAKYPDWKFFFLDIIGMES